MDGGDDASMPPSSYALVVLGALAYLALMMNWFSLAAFLAPISDDLGLSGAEAGILVGAIPLTYVPLSLLSGLALDRIGARAGVAIALVVFGSAQALRSFATGFWTMLAATVLLAVGGTFVTFGLPKLVSSVCPPRRLGSMSTVYILGSYAGIASAYSVGRGMLGPALGGWRPTFLLLGGVACAFVVVWAPVAWWHARRHGTPYGGDGGADFSLGSLRSDVTRVFSHRAMRLLVVVGVSYLLLQHGLQGWLPTVLESRGISATTAARIASLFLVGMTVGTILIPPASDRLNRRSGTVAACGVVTTVGVAGLAVAGRPLTAAAAVVVVGVGTGGVSPLIRAMPTELEDIGPELTATAVSLVFAVGEIGGFVGPLVVGTLHDVTGSFTPGIAVIAVGALAIVAAGIGLPEPGA